MGRGSKVIAVVVVAAGAAYALYGSLYQMPVREAQASVSRQNKDAATPPSRSGRSDSPDTPTPQAFTRSEYGYRWDPSKPGIATGEVDAAWLESRGFPGPDVEDHLRRLSLQELEALAARGNQPAAAIHAYTLAAAGGPRAEVLARLDKSASEGSVYALKTAGDIYLTVEGYRDPAMASAYYGLQARAGDPSGFEQRYLLSHQLNATQRLQSDLMQERLFRSMNSAPQSPFGLDPRPGFDAFLTQGSGAASTRQE